MAADQPLFRTKSEGRMPGFEGATGWLNSAPLTLDDLRGKVTLVNFWTYTCINWLRQLPYVRSWATTYGRHGLVTVGVHTPEFGFERDLDNVERAVRKMEIHYPVALDNDYSVWSAFANHYWPALYLADRDGRIRHHYFGEGGYQQTELIIRELLADESLPDTEATAPESQGAEAAADWGNLRSGETYLGYAQAQNFAGPSGLKQGTHQYEVPAHVPPNHWALNGAWIVTREASALSEAPGSVIARFHARDLHLVMGPGSRCETTRFRVSIDGEAPGDAHGDDIDADGYGAVTHQRLHQLIRQPGPIVDRTFEITFLDPDAQVYAFTFG